MELPTSGIAELDPTFAKMAVGTGKHVWQLPEITMREKAFLLMTGDLAQPHLGKPLEMHIMAGRKLAGLEPNDIRELLRHVGPYVGYAVLVHAFQRLHEIGIPIVDTEGVLTERPLNSRLAAAVDEITELDQGLGEFAATHFAQRWDGPYLSLRERALTALAVDVLYQTLDESFRLHVDLAVEGGADRKTLTNTVLLLAEFGIPRAWRAMRALNEVLKD